MSRVSFDQNGSQVTIELRRPEKGNAFDREMALMLAEAFQRANKSEAARFVLMKGQGRHFCTGADLNWMAKAHELGPKENLEDLSVIDSMYAAIAACELPVIALAHGKVRGGGMGLTAAADIAICDSKTTFALPEARMALATGVLTPLVMNKIGRSRFLYHAMTGFEMSAPEAKESGLVQFCGGESQIQALLKEFKSGIESSDGDTLKKMKRLSKMNDLPSHRWMEWSAEARVSDEAKRRMSAFLKDRER